MSVSSPRRQRFAGPWRSALVALGLVCILANATPLLSQETASSSAEEGQEAGEPATGEGTFLDEVTVTADHVPSSLRDTPGNVSIVTEEDIEDQLFEDVADLVRYEPGVYVEGDNTRLGLNGFNIRGIGGNRVLTQVDGVPGAEQFDFGPFNVHQQAIDIDTLKSAEIVRSAGSALYGSDAVGGVISLITKNPSDYLSGGNRHVGLKAGFDGRSNDSNLNLALAGGGDAGRASLFVSSSNGSELDNAGQTGGTAMDRDRPNPQERERLQALGKAAYDISTGNTIRAVFELNSTDAETEVFSALGTSRLGPFTFTNLEVLADDTQDRSRASLEPEISDNFELGLRWSAGGTSWSVNGFQNRYDDFIEFQNVGFNRQLRVVEFQNVNLTEVEIDGVEFRLESRLGDNVLLRAAYARIDGHDVTGGTSVPLASVAPNEGVLGLRYLSSSAKWGLDGSVRLVDDRDPEKVADGEHVPEGYEVVDLVAFFALPADMKLRIGVLNATDEAYFESWHVRGRQASDPRLLLYSSPGRNVVASLSYNW